MSRWDAVNMLGQILDTYEPGSRTRKAIVMGIDALKAQDIRRHSGKQRMLSIVCALSGIAIGIMFMMTLDIIGMK